MIKDRCFLPTLNHVKTCVSATYVPTVLGMII